MQDHGRAAGAEQAKNVDVSIFDTRTVAAGDQFDLWRESIGAIFDITADQDDAGNGYRARLDSAMINGAMVTRVQAGSQKFERSGLRPYRDGVEGLMFQVFSRGDVRCDDDASLLAPSHTITGFDLTREMSTVNSDFDLVSYIIPEQMLQDRLGSDFDVHLQAVGPDSALAHATADFMLGLQRGLPDMDCGEAHVALEAVVDLVAECYRGQSRKTAPDTAMDMARLHRAKRYIAASIESQTPLSTGSLARYLNCSRATLYRSFAPLGGVAAYVRSERLRACLRDLAQDRLDGEQMSIGTIAMRRGFESDAHFSRVFKAEFGISPKAARLALRAQPDGTDRFGKWQSVDRRYELWLRAIGN